MNTQVLFKMDKKLKEKAMKKARDEGIAFSSVLKLATKAFVDGSLRVELTHMKTPNNATQKRISSALKDIKKKKNLSPTFKNTDDAIAYLKEL